MFRSSQYRSRRSKEAFGFAKSKDFRMQLLAPPFIAALTGGHMLGGPCAAQRIEHGLDVLGGILDVQ